MSERYGWPDDGLEVCEGFDAGFFRMLAVGLAVCLLGFWLPLGLIVWWLAF